MSQTTLKFTGEQLTSADLDANPWAACGQTVLAALTGLRLADVRHAFPAHRWVNVAQMLGALSKLGVTHHRRDRAGVGPLITIDRGLVLLQWRGPWLGTRVELKHTHWIAVTRPTPTICIVFDVNVLGAGINHGWVPSDWWERAVLPVLLKEDDAEGWAPRELIEVPA